jgi:hypothetical protein
MLMCTTGGGVSDYWELAETHPTCSTPLSVKLHQHPEGSTTDPGTTTTTAAAATSFNVSSTTGYSQEPQTCPTDGQQTCSTGSTQAQEGLCSFHLALKY